MYPMINIYHANIGSLVFTVMIFTNIDLIIFNQLEDKESFKTIIYIVLVFMMIIETIYASICYILYFKNEKEKMGPYYGIIIESEKTRNIENICEYIKSNEENGINIKIISYRSNMYMCVLNRNNGIMDLPFYGNLGSKGEKGLIEKINAQENTKFLIDEDDKLFGQEAIGAIRYIKDNYRNEGKDEDFLIYSK